MDLFIGRQPILDENQEPVGYELLYRSRKDVNACTESSLDRAAATTLSRALLDFGLDRLVGNHSAYFNCPEQFLVDREHVTLPSHRTVLEVLENVEPTPDVLLALKEAKSMGFRIALDDVTLAGLEKCAPLLERADIIKVDFLAQPPADVQALVGRLSGLGKTLLAEKVETQEHFRMARELGFELFQGYFFARPEIVSERGLAPVEIQLLRLMGEIARTDIEIAEVEELISHDVSLSVKLLRYLSSAAVGLNRPISSIKMAVTYLGLEEIRRWVHVVALSHLTSSRPSELMAMSLLRGRFCESLTKKGKREPAAFTVGLLSLLDTILARPMPVILEELQLRDDVRAALLGEVGPLSDSLAMARTYERGDWNQVRIQADRKGWELTELGDWYLEAAHFATELQRSTS